GCEPRPRDVVPPAVPRRRVAALRAAVADGVRRTRAGGRRGLGRRRSPRRDRGAGRLAPLPWLTGIRAERGSTMTVELNHTIVPARDKHAAAQFLADILGLPVGLGNGVTLDFMDHTDVSSQHYAFLVDDGTFDAAYKRLLDNDIETLADPDHTEPGEINTRWGGRGVYFPDPNGHNLEILTRPPTDAS